MVIEQQNIGILELIPKRLKVSRIMYLAILTQKKFESNKTNVDPFQNMVQ